jgi:hypothetical protein
MRFHRRDTEFAERLVSRLGLRVSGFELETRDSKLATTLSCFLGALAVGSLLDREPIRPSSLVSTKPKIMLVSRLRYTEGAGNPLGDTGVSHNQLYPSRMPVGLPSRLT